MCVEVLGAHPQCNHKDKRAIKNDLKLQLWSYNKMPIEIRNIDTHHGTTVGPRGLLCNTCAVNTPLDFVNKDQTSYVLNLNRGFLYSNSKASQSFAT